MNENRFLAFFFRLLAQQRTIGIYRQTDEWAQVCTSILNNNYSNRRDLVLANDVIGTFGIISRLDLTVIHFDDADLSDFFRVKASVALATGNDCVQSNKTFTDAEEFTTKHYWNVRGAQQAQPQQHHHIRIHY